MARAALLIDERRQIMANFPFKEFTIPTDIIGSADLFITESDGDATTLNNNSFPSIGFPNNLMKKENYKILIGGCAKSKRIFIINSKSDSRRILEIGNRLSNDGIQVFILSIYDKTTNQFKSVTDYFKTYSAADFKSLIKSAPSFISFLIKHLPENFPAATPEIKDSILPLILKAESSLSKFYIDQLRKQVKISVKVVEDLIAEVRRLQDSADGEDEASNEKVETDPEILETASALAHSPSLLKDRIDTINRAGVAGERINIAILFCSLDSRLLLDQGIPGQNAIGCKISGHQGAGKSYTLMMVLSIYPKDLFIFFSGASEKALYYKGGGIVHKCLVFAEAFQLSNDRKDSEFLYSLRTLLSEGKLIRSIAERDETTKKFTARDVVLHGPVSFITTTIESNLEAQLDDRLFTIHPDESVNQTKRIITNRAKQKAGITAKLDDKNIRTWKQFHRLLQPATVIIPYAELIAEHLNRQPKLPISARRAFNKALNIIQAITVTYQFQRERDSSGALIATIPDYFMALQIIGEVFRENMGSPPKASTERLDYLTSQGHMSTKDLATHFGVSRAAISSWAKRQAQEGLIEWVDQSGNSFPNDAALTTAKKSGKAHIKVDPTVKNPWTNIGLPMPNDFQEFSQDWEPGGIEYEKFNLHLVPGTLPGLVTGTNIESEGDESKGDIDFLGITEEVIPDPGDPYLGITEEVIPEPGEPYYANLLI